MTREKITRDVICSISQFEPKIINEACKDDNQIKDMKEKLDQIEKNKIWILVPRPKDKNFIGTKWVFQNKLNENGEFVINKSKLVCVAKLQSSPFKGLRSLVKVSKRCLNLCQVTSHLSQSTLAIHISRVSLCHAFN